MNEPTDKEQYLSVADQCAATATSELAASILVDAGNGTLRQLLNDAADAIRAGWRAQPTADGVVAYLDIGAGGYLDLGTDLADEALSRLPKGRHALVIAGTYGIDGYTAASASQSAPVGVLEDAARWHWMAEYIVGTRTELDDELIACPTVDELRKLVDADLAARKQGGE